MLWQWTCSALILDCFSIYFSHTITSLEWNAPLCNESICFDGNAERGPMLDVFWDDCLCSVSTGLRLNMFHLWSFKAVRMEWFSVTLLCSGFKMVSPEKYINRLKRQSINLMHCLVSVPIIYSMTITRLWQFSNETKCLYFVLYKTFHWLLHLLFQ